MLRDHRLAILLVAIVCALLGAWLSWQLRRWLDRWLGRARQAQGKAGEQEAEQLLVARGYRILERQARRTYEIMVDGVRTPISLIVDFVVERGDATFVAEVKTGAGAKLTPQTRRQLLEYQLATGHRALLIDADANTITEVTFPLSPTRATGGTQHATLHWLLLGTITLLLYALMRSVVR